MIINSWLFHADSQNALLELKLILLAIIMLALAFAGFAIKLIVKKNGEFKKNCSTVDPKSGKPVGCTCGSDGKDQSQSESYKKHHSGDTKEY